jgi:tagatose 1,6-diphosphate aldolase
MDNVTYLDPGELVDDDLELVLEEKLAADSKRGHLPVYKFAMRKVGSEGKVGEIGLKIGEPPPHLGHISYRVFREHRGHYLAARACRLLVPLALRHGLTLLRITCREENVASRRTAELAGAEFVGMVDTPQGYSDWLGPVRSKCVYHLRTER